MKKFIRFLLVLKCAVLAPIGCVIVLIGSILHPIVWAAYYIYTGKSYEPTTPWFIKVADWLVRVPMED